MGTLLRILGGLLLFLCLFVPGVSGCGFHFGEAGLAFRENSALAILALAGGIVFAFVACIGPFLSKGRPRRLPELEVMGLCLAFAGGTLWLIDVVLKKGAELRWEVDVQFLALTLIFVGAFLRCRAAPRRRQKPDFCSPSCISP